MTFMLGFALLLQDELVERIRRLEGQIEQLKRENTDLIAMNQALNGNQIALEQRLTRLAQEMLQHGEPSRHVPVAAPKEMIPGPSETVKAKIRFVDTKLSFVILNAGESQGVEPGFHFDVWRDGVKIAVLEIEKFADDEKKMTKARVKEGDVKALVVGDEAVAYRVGTPNVETPEDFKEGLKAIEKSQARVASRVQDKYMVTVGQADGLQIGDPVFIYRNGKLRGALKLEFVDKDWSLGKRDDSLQNEEVFEGDVVSVKKLGPVLAGRIASEPARQGIFINIGQSDGAQPGQRYKVTRLGTEIGTIRLTTVHEHWAIGKQEGATATEQFEKGDFVELVP